jgi:hypothetical protein
MSSDVTKDPEVRCPNEEGPAEEPRSRRNLLKSLGAAAAAAVAGGILSPTKALAHGEFHSEYWVLEPQV